MKSVETDHVTVVSSPKELACRLFSCRLECLWEDTNDRRLNNIVDCRESYLPLLLRQPFTKPCVHCGHLYLRVHLGIYISEDVLSLSHFDVPSSLRKPHIFSWVAFGNLWPEYGEGIPVYQLRTTERTCHSPLGYQKN